MRTMYDDIVAQNVPVDGDLYAGYDDGSWPDAAALQKRFPGKKVVRVTTNPKDSEGDVLDVETGDAIPEDAPTWRIKRFAAGAKVADLYCNSSTWTQVIAQVAGQDTLPAPHYFIAQYDNDPTIPQEWINQRCVAKQYQSTSQYDTSVVLPYWPGIDPAPKPTEEEMVNGWTDSGGNTHVVGVAPDGNLLHFERAAGAAANVWTVVNVTAAIGGTKPFVLAV